MIYPIVELKAGWEAMFQEIPCKQIPHSRAELESEEMKANLLLLQHPSYSFTFISFSSSTPLFAHALTNPFVTPLTCPAAASDNGVVVIAVDGRDYFWLCPSR